MRKIIVSSSDAAIEQIEWAVRLFLDHEAYVPAITLSGAAEGMLSNAIISKGGVTAHKDFCAELVSLGIAKDESAASDIIREPRNIFNHKGQLSQFPVTEMDVAQNILRALVNARQLGISFTNDMDRFLKWWIDRGEALA